MQADAAKVAVTASAAGETVPQLFARLALSSAYADALIEDGWDDVSVRLTSQDNQS